MEFSSRILRLPSARIAPSESNCSTFQSLCDCFAGANLPTLLGVASTPVYLGLGPDEYFDPKTTMPEPLPFDEPPTSEQIEWLQRAGVTHVLSFSELDERLWPVTPVWSGYDPLLSRAWARGPGEPLYLYELKESRGRRELA